MFIFQIFLSLTVCFVLGEPDIEKCREGNETPEGIMYGVLNYACQYKNDGEPANNAECSEYMARELSLCWPQHSWSCAIDFEINDLDYTKTSYVVKGTEGNLPRTAICDKIRYDKNCEPNSATERCQGIGSYYIIHTL